MVRAQVVRMMTRPATILLVTLSLTLAACAGSTEDVTQDDQAIDAEQLVEQGTVAAAIKLTEDNCELETFLPHGDASPPLFCYPTGDLFKREAFLRSAAPEAYKVGRGRSGGKSALAITDPRPFPQRLAAFGGLARVGAPYFFVLEEPSVVAVRGHTELSKLDPGSLEITAAEIVELSSDLGKVAERVRDAFHGSTQAQWTSGQMDLQGEPLAPRACRDATVVLRVEEGGLLPRRDGAESFALPPVAAFFCDD